MEPRLDSLDQLSPDQWMEGIETLFSAPEPRHLELKTPNLYFTFSRASGFSTG